MAAFLGGLASKASALPGVGGLVPKVPTVAGAASEGQNKVKQFLLEGFSIPWVALLVLAGFPPVPPISFWGYGAVNLMVAGSKGWAMAKGALQLAFVAASKFVSAYYPKLSWINWILWLNPWFIFDLVQLFSPTFEVEGFKVPFAGTQIRPEDGVYRLNGITIGIMLGLFSLGGFSLLSYLPPQVVGAAEPALKLLFKIIGGVAAVGGGGLGMMLLPELLKSAKEDVGAVKAAAAAAAPVQAAALPGTALAAGVPALPAAAAVAAGAPAKQQGGAAAGSIPPLHEVAAGLLDPSTASRGYGVLGAPFRSTVITGGGKAASISQPSMADSAIFVGVLGLAALAGLGLAVVRSKADSPM